MHKIIFIISITLIHSLLVKATPLRVLIIRHAEKSIEEVSDPHLSPAGFRRAEALKKIFEIHPEYAQPNIPDFFYAAQYVPGSSSNRSIETLTPLVKKLGRNLNTDWASESSIEFGKMLLNNPFNDKKIIMIAWKRSEIPNVALGLKAPCKTKWNADVFDRIWVIDYRVDGGVSCRDLPQSVLPGDSLNESILKL